MPGTDHENPYAPPRAGQPPFRWRRSLRIGDEEITTVVVETSLWTGLRTHATRADGSATPVHRGPCRFQVGERERHDVRIEVDQAARINAFVDGELLEANLFPKVRLRAFLFTFAMIGLVLVGILLVLVLTGWW